MEIAARRFNLKMLAVLAIGVAMALSVFCLGGGAAEAAQHDVDVTFLNASNPSVPSMADAAIAGTALYDDVAETLTIPLEVIVIGGQSGYINEMTVELSGGPVPAAPDAVPYPNGGSITIPIPADEAVDEAQFDVEFDVLLDPADTHVYAPAIMDLDFL